MKTVNIDGVYYIQNWIDSNQHKNPRIFDLWAAGIASEINRSDFEEELERNGYYSFELRMKDAQGHQLVIELGPEHFSE